MKKNKKIFKAALVFDVLKDKQLAEKNLKKITKSIYK